MKTVLSLLLLLVTSAIVLAQDYLGTYEAVPPPGMNKAAWSLSQPRFEILTTRVIYTYGSIEPAPSNITYAKEGNFLLAEDRNESRTLYYPIYLYDKDTIFALGNKLTRVEDGNSSGENGNLGTYEAVPPPGFLADPQRKAT